MAAEGEKQDKELSPEMVTPQEWLLLSIFRELNLVNRATILLTVQGLIEDQQKAKKDLVSLN